MSGGETCPKCLRTSDPGQAMKRCDDAGCPIRELKFPDGMFLHISPKPDACKHDFQGWIELKDEEGRVGGGTTVCTKCGMDAMSYSLRCGD